MATMAGLPSAGSFSSDFPFPCLLNPEDDNAAAAAAPSNAPPLASVDEGTATPPPSNNGAGSDDGDDEAFAFEEDLESAVQTLRLASAAACARPPLLADGTPAADYDVHPQHRRDGKEALPASLPTSHYGSLLTPAVIGSLPKAMTQVEKAALSSSLRGPSPASARFLEMPVTHAGSRTAAGTAFRRAALKGAVVAFITAGYSGKRFVYERAKELGVASVILDGPDAWSRALAADGTAAAFVPVDFAGGGAEVFDRCLSALTKVREERGLDAVCTFNELAVPLAARLAERLGLPGNPPTACDLARDKGATRRLMAAAGLPSPKHATINSDADVDAAARHVGFPAVIKPTAAAASLGVVRVDSPAELRAKVAATRAQLASLYLDEKGNICEAAAAGGDGAGDAAGGGGANCAGKVLTDADRAKIANFVSKELVMEEYLDGDEVDCDLVMSDGACTYGAVTDNWPTIEPYFNETGSNCPSVLPVSTQQELLDLAVASVQALGFRLGVFHVELKATSRGPRLIEVNARMGGGGVRDINRAVWGVDLVEEHLLASCGLPARPLIARRPLLRLAEYSINAPATGVLACGGFLAPWAGAPGVIYARELVEEGDKVVSVADGMPTWICEICVHKATVREAIEYVKQVEREIELDIRPVKG